MPAPRRPTLQTHGLIRRGLPVASLGCLLALACSAEDEENETKSGFSEAVQSHHLTQSEAAEDGVDVTTKAFQASLVAGLEPVVPRVVGLEPINVRSEPDFSRMASLEPEEYSDPDDAAPTHRLVAYVEAGKSEVQLLAYDEKELRSLANTLASRGIAEPAVPSDAQVGTQVMGWSSPNAFSNGVDNRIDLSSALNWEYRTTGRLWAAGGCTATLFGRRLAITAAHCVVDAQGNYVAGQLSLHQNGTTRPYGTQNVLGAWFGGKFRANCTNGAPGFWSECMPEEWALLLLEDRFTSGHPGWMGFAYPSENYVAPLTKRSVGYPGCGFPESPASCVSDRLYGQTGSCVINQFMYPFSNGFNSTFSHSCDTSPGQSGSAHYYNDGGNPYIFGVSAVQRCTTCTIAEEPNSTIRRYPNLDKRIDDYIYNLMVNLRAQYP